MTLDTNGSPVRGARLGSKMAGGNPDASRGRAHHDYYDTPQDATLALLGRYPLRLHGGIRVWEPCAGRGAMARVIRERIPQAAILCTDVVPALAEHAAGFPVLPLDLLQSPVGKPVAWADAVITNPPFGIAGEIIRRLCSVPESGRLFMALLLKSTFWHARSRHWLFGEHPPTHIHPLLWRPDFEGMGAPTMDLSWNVWCPVANPARATLYEPLPRPGSVPGRPFQSGRPRRNNADNNTRQQG